LLTELFAQEQNWLASAERHAHFHNMHPTTRPKIDLLNKATNSNNELHLFKAVLEQVCRDLNVTDDAMRSRLQDSILFLAKQGVRDFETLRSYAERPRINRFSMVDPA
jgi:hypothetical protein